MTLVDTSAWIEFLRGTGSDADREVEALLRARRPVHTTTEILLELLAGAGGESEAGRLSGLADTLVRLPGPDRLDVERTASLYRGLGPERARGTLLPCLVSVLALRHDLDIVAHDPVFRVIAGSTDLRLRGLSTDPEADGPPGEDGGPAHVLVVEDEASDAELLSDALTAPGRRVTVVGTALEARGAIHRDVPQVVVLDLVLPDEDGRGLIGEIRRAPGGERTGVVVVTGRAGPRTKEECLALGADDFLEKPVEGPRFAEAVRRAHRIERDRADPLTAIPNLADAIRGLPPAVPGSQPWTVALLRVGRGEGAAPLPEALRRVGSALRQRYAEGDIVARWGIDELVVLSEDLDQARASALVEVVREAAPPGVRITSVVRRVGRDEDLLDALSHMEGVLGQKGGTVVEEGEGAPPGERAAGPVRPTAVLVEDDPVTAALVRHRLERSGFVVDVFDDGAEGLRAIIRSPPSVVILDVQLPSMDGFEILGRIRERERPGDPPVLMLTSLGRKEHVTRAFTLGADDYVTKPFSPSELLTRVLRLVRKS